jgi:hypothetical protein
MVGLQSFQEIDQPPTDYSVGLTSSMAPYNE